MLSSIGGWILWLAELMLMWFGGYLTCAMLTLRSVERRCPKCGSLLLNRCPECEDHL